MYGSPAVVNTTTAVGVMTTRSIRPGVDEVTDSTCDVIASTGALIPHMWSSKLDWSNCDVIVCTWSPALGLVLPSVEDYCVSEECMGYVTSECHGTIEIRTTIINFHDGVCKFGVAGTVSLGTETCAIDCESGVFSF